MVSVGVGGRGSDALIDAVRSLDAAGVRTQGLALRRPSLDDVFLALTGHAAEEEEPAGQARGRGRGKRVRATTAEGCVMTTATATAVRCPTIRAC